MMRRVIVSDIPKTKKQIYAISLVKDLVSVFFLLWLHSSGICMHGMSGPGHGLLWRED